MTNQTEHLRQCEARHVLKMNKDGRSRFYALVRKFRSDEAVNELIKNVKADYEKLPEWQKKRLGAEA